MSTRRYDGSNTTGLEGFARAMRAKRKAGAFKRTAAPYKGKKRAPIAVRRGNGAPMAIAHADSESVTVQGWTHRETFSRESFREVFTVKRVAP